MKMMSVILMTLCLGLFGCSGDSGSGSSEPPSFDSSGTWNTRTNQPAPVLMVTLVLDQESSSSPHISGEWGSQGDPCFASGTTNGFSGTISASQITLYLTDESAGQVRQIRASLNGIGGPPTRVPVRHLHSHTARYQPGLRRDRTKCVVGL